MKDFWKDVWVNIWEIMTAIIIILPVWLIAGGIIMDYCG